MDEVMQFIKDFIATDYQFQLACLTERDYNEVVNKAAQLKKQFYEGMLFGIPRPISADEKWFEEVKKRAAEIKPRMLFKIESYKQPKFGELFRVYLSAVSTPDHMSENFIVIKKDGGYKIISLYYICPDCNGSGMINGVKCNTCRGWGYEFAGGRKIDSLGKLVETKEF